MGATNRRPSSEIWTDFSHGNEVACLCDKRFVSGASSTVLKSRFRTDLWSQGVLVTGWNVFSTSQKHYQYPHVIGMEFLYSFLRRHFAGKPVVASRNVGCLLRLVFEVLTIFLKYHFCQGWNLIRPRERQRPDSVCFVPAWMMDSQNVVLNWNVKGTLLLTFVCIQNFREFSTPSFSPVTLKREIKDYLQS